MTSKRTRSERLLHETVGASVLPRHLGHRHLHTHIFAYTNTCVNTGCIAERTQFDMSERFVRDGRPRLGDGMTLMQVGAR